VTWWRRFDPRLHLSAAIGWAVFAVLTVAALLTANLAANEAEKRVRTDGELLLTQFATQISNTLAMSLTTHRSIILATGAQIVASSDRGDAALRRHLEAVQAQFPEFAWLGVADELGHVTAASGGALEGEDVSNRSWFQQGLMRPFLSGVHQALLPGLPSRQTANDQPPRLIDLAVPLTQTSGRTVGVLGAQLSWTWIEGLQTDLLHSLDTPRQLELLLMASDGTVLIGPPDWLGLKLPEPTDLSQGGTYLVGQHLEQRAQTGWRVVLRQEATPALEPARATRQVVFLSVLLAGLLSAAAVVWATQALTRRLSELASQAMDVQRGKRQSLLVPPGRDEVSRIGTTLAEVLEHLHQEKKALQVLNAELDARVVERTARIERLADDARHAAVTRERLRLARDLHDTLAHSLMALLTQIRLVRKLRARMSEQELEEELERAEAVTASGLADARAAITQMRHNGVRESGLVAALQELLRRFREHTGVAATLQAGPVAADLATERAETVFRIAEEALHNVEQHAQARTVTLRLDAAPLATDGPAVADAGDAQRFRMEIIDDGVGFDPALPKPGHYGLRGIEEQAGLIHARFELHSQPGQGTRIVVEFDA